MAPPKNKTVKPTKPRNQKRTRIDSPEEDEDQTSRHVKPPSPGPIKKKRATKQAPAAKATATSSSKPSTSAGPAPRNKRAAATATKPQSRKRAKIDAVDNNDNPTWPATPPDVKESLVHKVTTELQRLTFNPPADPAPTLQALTQACLQGLRPGLALLGTPAEEEASYARDPYFRGAPITAEDEEDSEDAQSSSSDSEDEEIDLDDFRLVGQDSGVEVEELATLARYRKLHFGYDFLALPSGEFVPTYEYLGPSWDKRIEELYAIKPLETPPHMMMIPRDFQLKAAAQGLYCLRGLFRLFLLGDEMGVGKTLTAILIMHALRDQPGMSIVLAPKSVCKTWVDTMNNAWRPGHGLRGYLLDDGNLTQAHLLAGGFDVLVCSYEFFDANGRAMHAHNKAILARANTTDKNQPIPQRPTSSLHTELWRILKMPFKVAILDEAQKVHKQGKLRHKAIVQHLHADSFALLSGTFPNNRWYNFSGYLDFGINHPFPTLSRFLHTFASFDQSESIEAPSEPRMRLLQKFLQAFLIARPASILDLKDCLKHSVPFKLTEAEAAMVSTFTFDYQRLARINTTTMGDGTIIGDADSSIGGLAFAVKAQMASLHPMLTAAQAVVPGDKQTPDQQKQDEEGPDSLMLINEEEDVDAADRDEWLGHVRKRENIIEESGRLTCLMRLYEHLRTKYPNEKIIIFSQSLRFLDIVNVAFEMKYGIQPLRFDGTRPPTKRDSIEKEFHTCDPSRPILITVNAGGVGLNIQAASIVILCEPQWNKNTEKQALGRAHRQGQLKQVKFYRLEGVNSEIDAIIVAIQTRKARVNEKLMRPLIRTPEEGPANVELLTFPGFLPRDISLE